MTIKILTLWKDKAKTKQKNKIVYLAGDKKKLTALSWEIVWVVFYFKKISMQVKNQETCIKILEIKFIFPEHRVL